MRTHVTCNQHNILLEKKKFFYTYSAEISGAESYHLHFLIEFTSKKKGTKNEKLEKFNMCTS